MLFVHLLCACVMRGFWCRFSGWTLGMWIPLLLFCLENGIPSQVTVFLMLALLRWIFVIASGASCPHFRRDWSYIVYIEASRFGCFEIRLTAWTNFGIFILGLLLKICWPWVPRTAVPKQQWNQPNQHTWRLGVLPKIIWQTCLLVSFFCMMHQINIGGCVPHLCECFWINGCCSGISGVHNCLDCQTGGLF